MDIVNTVSSESNRQIKINFDAILRIFYLIYEFYPTF